MYPIGTRPFLEYTLINLLNSRHVDVSDDQLVLVVGHLGEQVAAYFGDSFHGLAISYVQQPERLGTGHAVETIAKTVRSDMPAVVWLADLYVPTELFEACAAHPLEHVLTLRTRTSATSPLGCALVAASPSCPAARSAPS